MSSRPTPSATSVTSSIEDDLPLASLAMFGDTGWAVTYSINGPIAEVLRTRDGGHSWRAETPPTRSNSVLLGVAPIDANRAWVTATPADASGGAVDLWVTTDGGASWSRGSVPGLAFRGAVMSFVNPTIGWLATPGEPASESEQQAIVIDSTSDGGRSWKRVSQTAFPPAPSTAGAPSLDCGKSGIAFHDVNRGWLTGGCTGGITFDVSTDGGATWRNQALPSPDGRRFAADCAAGSCSLTAPHFVTSAVGYMVLHDAPPDGDHSWFYATTDGGYSWTPRPLPGQESNVVMLTSSDGFATVGPASSTGAWLYRTADGGRSWQQVPTNLRLSYSQLNCGSASKCWALTLGPGGPRSPSLLYETSDAGQTWEPIRTELVSA